MYDAVGDASQTDRRSIAASIGSAVKLSCTSPTSTLVTNAEWDFHSLNTGNPTLIYDGRRVNPELADKYDTICNSSSNICDLQINRLQETDVGEYQCYLKTTNRTLKFVYRLSIIGMCWHKISRNLSVYPSLFTLTARASEGRILRCFRHDIITSLL